ncbi:hypothetical protein [Natranaeroarchaeum aerophilus]|uniref:RING-type E3 ubiquitin transferase n=1 Tax=Natranaeroarchaeum aerophilus TaxID=2917711 RepID=A0AAE3FQG7_9EURY|nr:hypothetical protein [Natranaeroarchaeum aerophilus]MCL9812764.1 hypothetical protein [Natranaeroarchaeum aerophilus]
MPGTVPIPVLLFVGVFMLIGVGAVFVGARALRRAVLFWRSEPVDVMEVAHGTGRTELEASAVPADETLTAPFTGTECLAYEYKVQRYRSSDNGSNWRTMHSDDERVQFLVEDETGSVVIESEDADLSLTSGDRITVGRDETAEGRIAEFLETIDDVDPGEGASSDIGPITVSTGDKRRYVERRIDVGDTVHVYGQINDRPFEGPTGTVNAAIGDGPETPLFHVADASASNSIQRQFAAGVAATVFGLMFMLVPGIVLASELL